VNNISIEGQKERKRSIAPKTEYYNPVGHRLWKDADESPLMQIFKLLGYADVEYAYDDNGNMISRTTRITHKQGLEKLGIKN
jgi:hypothetical protein